MVRACLVACGFIVALGTPEGSAGVLTCEAFKLRLDQAIQALGRRDPVPLVFSSTHEGGGIGRRYAWRGISGLTGRLTCGPDDAFADFYMVLQPDTRGGAAVVPDDLTSFKTLGAGSVCALSAGTPEACRSLVATMTEDAIDQYDEDRARGAPRPQNLQDYDVTSESDAVFLVSPIAISWAIGPGVYNTVDTTRAALKPHDRDEDVDE